jgi:hypothetical protein
VLLSALLKECGVRRGASWIISEADVMDAMTLPKVRMPNRDRFAGVELDWKPGQKRPLGFYPGK